MANDPIYKDIGERLVCVRVGFSSLNKSEWAARHTFNQSQYFSWEQGKRRITVDEAQKLSDLYGLSLDWIYRGRVDGLSESARKVLLSQ